MLYMAYGLNMDIEAMNNYRCPTAKFLGIGKLLNHRIAFSSFATVVPDENDFVPIMLWDIQPSDEKSLDHVESYPTYYDKKIAKFEWVDNIYDTPDTEAMVYVMQPGHVPNLPSRGYYCLIQSMWEKYGFDTTSLQRALNESLHL